MGKLFKINDYTEQGTTYDHLLLEVNHRKWQGGMVFSFTPVHKTDCGYEQVYDYQRNPLTAGIDVLVAPMPRKNQKRLDAAFADLCGMGPHICELWNKRNFDEIKTLFS